MKWAGTSVKDCKVLIVVVLCKVDMVYLLGQNYLLHNRSLHEAVRKFLEGFMK